MVGGIFKPTSYIPTKMNELFAKHLNDGTNVPNELLKKAIEDGFDKDDLLYRSVSFRFIESTRWLLENGANANSIDLCETASPFMNVNFPMLDLLLQYGADIKEDNKKRRSVLSYFILRDDVYKKLLQRGARLDTSRRWCSVTYKQYFKVYRKFLITHKWLLIRCAVKFLGLHSRAVVSANHPLRKLERGEFKDEDELFHMS